MKATRLQSLAHQAVLHAHNLDDPPSPENLARLMSRTLSSRHLAYFTHGELVVWKENKAGEMELLFDTSRGAALQNVCQWYCEEVKNRKKL